MAAGGLLSAGAGRGPAAVRMYVHPSAGALAGTLPANVVAVPREHPPEDEPGLFLWAVDDHLELRRRGEAGIWLRTADVRRRAADGGTLARACGAAPGLEVLDPMAGWGIDALVLAARGCRVTLIESNPLVALMQQDLVRRSGATGIRCLTGDGFCALDTAKAFDVVYLDPMFPERRKAALPGKRMQWLAELAKRDQRPLSQWIDAACRSARTRVVLKRRRKDPVHPTPGWQIVGRTVRYDVYRAGQFS